MQLYEFEYTSKVFKDTAVKVVMSNNPDKDFKEFIIEQFCENENNVHIDDCRSWLEGVNTKEELKKYLLNMDILVNYDKVKDDIIL